MQNARFKPMQVIEAKLCRHLVFQMSFRNVQRQKCYRNFLDDRSELWPSKLLWIKHQYILNQIPNATSNTFLNNAD